MVHSCCICKLEWGIVPDVSFHNIPKREEIKLKWLAVIGREVHKNSRVCSNHFVEGDFFYKVIGDNVKRFLSCKAVPMKHGHSDSESVQRQTMKPNNSDNNNVSIPQVDQSLISETNLSIDSHNYESMKGDESHESQFNTLSDKEINKVKQQNVLVAKKSNKNSDDDITLENQQDLTILKKLSLKRQSSDTQSLMSVKRVYNPRYLGDLTREDFTSDIAYTTVNDHLNNHKKKQKVLNQKVRRLIKKVRSLQLLLDHFKENGLTEGSMELEDKCDLKDEDNPPLLTNEEATSQQEDDEIEMFEPEVKLETEEDETEKSVDEPDKNEEIEELIESEDNDKPVMVRDGPRRRTPNNE
ncbi:uncharacterized protein LOC143218599 [Lasioglossum baleicum]|uniref:uncharacterized protein LOC143218599 n=1 Tax=Lasioglossum baleicum TaxID=434251 RepID=UPI003FCD9286